MKYFLAVFIFITSISVQSNSHIIPSSSDYVDANGMNINPGDTILLEGGFKSYFQMKNFHGSEDNYLTIINYNGQLKIQNDTFYGMVLNNCSYFRLTGTGDPSYEYGIKIAGTKEGASALSFDNLSTNFEVDHIEICNSGFAGIMSKTDPRCDLSSNRGNFTQYNTIFHHNYIHNTLGEGFYIGHSYYNGWERECDGKTVVLYPHDVVNVQVYDNIIDSTGYDGLQMDCAVEGCEIFNNVIKNSGMADDATGQYYGMSGIVIGGGTSGRCYNNFILDSRGNGISVFGLGDNWIFNNLIIDAGRKSAMSPDPPDHHHPYGIFCDDRTTIEGRSFNFINNTIVNSKDIAIRFWSLQSSNNRMYNNLIVNPGVKAWDYNRSMIDLITPLGEIADTLSRGNHFDSTEYQSIHNPYFKNTDLLDFHLKKGTLIIDAGIVLDSLPNLNFDFDNLNRPIGNGTDVGAYEYPSLPTSLIITPDAFEKCEGGQLIIEVEPKLPLEIYSYTWFKNGDEVLTLDQYALQIENLNIDDEGSYYCKIHNDYDTLSSNESYISVKFAPFVNAGNDTLICINHNEIQLQALVENYTHLEWNSSGDGTFSTYISSETTYYPGPEDKNSGSVELSLIAFAEDPCPESIDNLTVIIDACTGIYDLETVMLIRPNPVSEFVFIDNIMGTKVNLNVFNQKGILKLSSQLKHKVEKVFVGDLSPGLYLFKLFKENQLYTQKILIR